MSILKRLFCELEPYCYLFLVCMYVDDDVVAQETNGCTKKLPGGEQEATLFQSFVQNQCKLWW